MALFARSSNRRNFRETMRAFVWQNGTIVDLNTLVPANSPLRRAIAAASHGRRPCGNFMRVLRAFMAATNSAVGASRHREREAHRSDVFRTGVM